MQLLLLAELLSEELPWQAAVVLVAAILQPSPQQEALLLVVSLPVVVQAAFPRVVA